MADSGELLTSIIAKCGEILNYDKSVRDEFIRELTQIDNLIWDITPFVTCDKCGRLSESGWGDTALCLECESPKNICDEHQRTFVGSCPLD
jgi:hypothetical protein